MFLNLAHFSETPDVDHIFQYDHTLPKSFKSVTGLCQTKLQSLIGIGSAILIIVGFVLLVSFTVKCDEDKLITRLESRRTSFEEKISNWASNALKQKQIAEQNFKSQKIKWVPKSEFNELTMEPAGYERDKTNDVLLYVARASHLNGMVVGKYCFQLKTMYIGYNGRESTKAGFELLTFPRGTLSWIPTNTTMLPQDDILVNGGVASASSENTYICRGKSQGNLFIGKFLPSVGKCLVAYKGREFPLTDFEMLAVNEMGKMMGLNK